MGRTQEVWSFALLRGLTLVVGQAQDVATKYRGWYRHMLVDEFQDTNAAQYEFVSILGSAPVRHMQCAARVVYAALKQYLGNAQVYMLQNTVFAVGDPNQAIFSWRGADVRKMADAFEADFESR